MPEAHQIKYTESIARQIAYSRRQVTILFTDIEYSTLHWDVLGDVDGRLMVDQHNRLLFPVIKKFQGKIIKTIGDAIMASFKAPEHAVKAAIGIQQILSQARSQEQGLCFNVRIGIHTGTGIVEHKDIFGDVVNVAARVQSRCRGDEILITGSTKEALDSKEYELHDEHGFIPKGKREEITVFRCEWRNHWDLVNDIEPSSFLSISARDKADVFIYAVTSLGLVYLIYLKYLRYIISDYESLALLSLNPSLLLYDYPFVTATLTAIIVLMGWWLFNINNVPHHLFRLLKGGFGFCIAFLAVYLTTVFIDLGIDAPLEEKIFESKHLFVQVLEDATSVHLNPSNDTPVISTVDAGALLLLDDLTDQSVVTWNKVLIAHQAHGWVQRLIPAKLGVPEKRITTTERFYFRYRDLVSLLAGCIGFIWGLFSFRIRPI
jgi:class 3 adenylate cyclase